MADNACACTSTAGTTSGTTVALSDRSTEAAMFKSLGDERRLRMLDIVAANPGICACELLKLFEMSQPTLSHHMKLLCEAGLVTCSKNGKWANYRISSTGFQAADRYIKELGTLSR